MNESYNADISADARPGLRAFCRGARRALRLGRALLGCLVFLAAEVRANGPQPGDIRDIQYQQIDTGPSSAQIAQAKRRSSSSGQVAQFEQAPQRIDYFKLGELQQEEALNRERARKRIMLPSEAVASQSVGDLLTQPDGGSRPVLASVAQGSVARDIGPVFIATLLFLAAGIIALHKFVPSFAGFTHTAFNPSFAKSATDTPGGPIELGGDRFFSDFQARFRIDAPAPGANEFAGLTEADILKSARRCVRRMRKLMQEIRLSTKESVQRNKLFELLEKLRSLREIVSNSGFLPLQQMISALEPLIDQLTDKTENISSSTIRTLGQGIDLLADLCKPNSKHDLLSKAPLRFLVVDDESFSRYALSMALKRTLSAPEVADDAVTALEMTSQQTYDLIFLDVNMPDMDGFQLCRKIHETVPNQRTAVVFVTGLRDFDTRVKSILCGGRDLIPKPFLTFELSVKALTMAARERLHSRGNPGHVAENPA